MTEEELVEKVARAICMGRHGGYPVEVSKADRVWKYQWWPAAERDARAAIAAMREAGWMPPGIIRLANHLGATELLVKK